MSAPQIIAKLPEGTIQMIAAGEVITRPVNVVKELIENSIDADSRSIRIKIEQGGLRLIEIIDNGEGIAKSNAPVLCQRYTTSKLKTADDLNKLSTFGFRGEALASISEVADIEVKSFNMRADNMGWHGRYRKGKLYDLKDKYCELPGTQIRVTELFSNPYNVSRRSILACGFVDEKKKIIDLVTKLAIHHRAKITFNLSEKVASDLACSIAPIDMGPCIGNFYGSDMEYNMFELDIKNDESYKVDIHIAFTYKKSSTNLHNNQMILFANDRLVECDELKKEVAALILEYFSNKQYLSLVYISLKVPLNDIDVNTHPAKATVSLHFQQEIIALVLTELRAKFNDNLSSQIVPSKNSQQRTIGELIKVPSSSQSCSSHSSQSPLNERRLKNLAPGCFVNSSSPQHFASTTQSTPKRPHEQVHNDSTQPNLEQFRLPPSRFRKESNLKSIADLKAEVTGSKTTDAQNIKLIKSSTFVGLFDHDRALIQYETKLFAINFTNFFQEQLYQFYLFDFGNFPSIEILPPGNKMRFMIEMYLDNMKRHEAKKFERLKFNEPNLVIDKLFQHQDLLKEYLSITFTRQDILTLPNIWPNHIPNVVYIGQFLVEITNHVDYSDELQCFRKLGRLLAKFYSRPPCGLNDMQNHKKYHDSVETNYYEAIKRFFIVPGTFFTKENICQLTDTKDLYKVFERC